MPPSTIAKAIDELREIKRQVRQPSPCLVTIDNAARSAIGCLLSTDEDEFLRYWDEHCDEHGAHRCTICAANAALEDLP